MEEDLMCIPYIDGVVHDPHPYTPQDHDEEMYCLGHPFPSKGIVCDEHRAGEQYRLAIWVDYSGIKTLHKTRAAQTLEQAREWLKEYQEDFDDGKWFIVRDITEVCSVVME